MKTSSRKSRRPKTGRGEHAATDIGGEVGIFWLLPSGKLLKYGVPVSEGRRQGDVVALPLAHERFWAQLRPHAPALRHLEYDRVPRGRVVYRPFDSTFILYVSGHTAKNTKVIRQVQEAFRLIKLSVQVCADDDHD